MVTPTDKIATTTKKVTTKKVTTKKVASDSAPSTTTKKVSSPRTREKQDERHPLQLKGTAKKVNTHKKKSADITAETASEEMVIMADAIETESPGEDSNAKKELTALTKTKESKKSPKRESKDSKDPKNVKAKDKEFDDHNLSISSGEQKEEEEREEREAQEEREEIEEGKVENAKSEHAHFNESQLAKEEKELTKIAEQLIEESAHPAEDEQLQEIRDSLSAEFESLSDEYGPEDLKNAIRNIDFFAGNNSDECLERFCENIKTTLGYCRYHYIKNWKAIKKKRLILKEGKLQSFIEELIKKYPPKYIEAILSDLSGEKEFYQVLKELNIDTNFQEDDAADMDLDDDITVETRGYGGSSSRVSYDDDEVL